MGDKTSKTASKQHSEWFVRPSQIVVWEHKFSLIYASQTKVSYFIFVHPSNICRNHMILLMQMCLNHNIMHYRIFYHVVLRVWKVEPAFPNAFPNAFSNHFSRERELYLGYKSLKSASKTHSERLVRPPSIDQTIAQFRDHLREHRLGTLNSSRAKIIARPCAKLPKCEYSLMLTHVP